MAKRVYKQSLQFEKDHPGCMGGLISIFDFRTGRPAQRMISDKQPGSSGRDALGAGYPRTRLNLLANGSETQEGTDGSISDSCDCEESRTTNVGSQRTSVKALMDEEMSKPQPLKKQITGASNEQIRSNSGRRVRLGKKRKQINKTCKVICDLHPNDFGTSASSEPRQSNHPKLMERFSVVEESGGPKCQIKKMHPNLEKRTDSSSRKSSGLTKRGPPHKLQKHPIIEEKLSEDAESFLNQKFIHAKQLIRDGALHRSKEYMDLLEILNSNKELFQKLLQDPNSLLVKHIQELRNAQSEKLSKVEGVGNSKQCNDETVSHKQSGKQNMHSFFRRKDKTTQIKNVSNKIVILKPKNPVTIRDSMTLTSSSSSSQSHYTSGNQAESERFTSHFSLTEITRKLKHAIRERKKEQNSTSADGILHRIPTRLQDSRAICSTSSQSERTSEHSKLNECQSSIEYEAAFSSSDNQGDSNQMTVVSPHQRDCNVYNEAKKHLAQMLNAGHGGEDLPTGQSPRTLGRILSMPECNMLSLRSSPRDKEPGTVSGLTRDSYRLCGENVWFFNKGKPANRSSRSLLTQKAEDLSCTEGGYPDGKIQERNSDSELPKGNLPDPEIQESIWSRGESWCDIEIVEVRDDVRIEENTPLNIPSELQSNTPIIDNNHSSNVPEKCEQDGSSEFLKPDPSKEKTTPTSTLSPFSGSHLLIDRTEAPENISEKPERPSPVSILEPFFVDDVISPASPQIAKLPVEPRRIHFDERDNRDIDIATLDPEINLKDCVEQKELKFKYVRAVLEASGLQFDESIEWRHFAHQPLNPSLFDEVEASSTRSSHEWRLLFDCINEVLEEVYQQFFSISPWTSFVKPNIRPTPVGKDVVHKVWRGIDRYLNPEFPHTLDEITGKDMEKSGKWMDLRIDVECIGIDMGEVILEELMEEAILQLQN
ncbi:uncharacterized protein LOC131224723 isoform X2 [Magnolia sinica]|uniref:uncharacterized protein LOC131224723 isoform X2 n=1 Tax=Magnolia sinica TaxID=86752 RepID=UPI002657DD70|nr:uncharacterized protein LOC131224723 isoform X2 [Magnolia sinica]